MMKRFSKTFIAIALILSMVLPVLAPYVNAAGKGSSGLKDYHSMTMEQIFASKEDLTWVMTGDSITHNGSWTQGMNSYTEWFEQYLYDIGRGDDAVINTAWGGADILDFLYKKDTPSGNGVHADPGMGLEQFITKYNPDVVTIKLGMNNRGMTTNNFVRYYKMMLDGIYAEGKKNGKIPKVIILTPTPMSGETIFDQAQEDQDSCWRFQKCLKEIAEEYDLLFVDLMTAFTTEATKLGAEYRSTFFVDPSDGGIHPNAAGHYLIYKTFSQVLGIYDEKLHMYQYEYEELKYAPLWQGSTGNLDLANNGDEMNKAMPSVQTGSTLLSYADFDALSGRFVGAADSYVDMTDSSWGAGALTLEEAKGMGKTYTLVFRANLTSALKENQAVLFLSGTGVENWNNALTLGAPGKKNQVYYQMRINSTGKVSGGGQIDFDSTTEVVVGKGWHTVAIVQTEAELQYYVDGVLSWKGNYTLGANIGELFSSANAVHCRIGNYGGSATGYYLNGSLDYWALYDGALSATEVKKFSENTAVAGTEDWSAAFKENNLWVVAGAEQMSGYQGTAVYRSLFRLLDNTVRNTGSDKKTHRDIRLLNAAAPGYTVAQLNANYEALIGEHNGQVLLLLPEVHEVYASYYSHSAQKVSQYKDAVNALIAKAKADGMAVILWTPLASGNDAVNAYLKDYADAVREIAQADDSLMLFDANKFMNDNMLTNGTLKNNWFEESMYISPLCALDVARAFFTKCLSSNVPTAKLNELTTHNLRDGSDSRTVKGNYLRDYISYGVAVNGDKVSVDVSAILAAYPGITNLRVGILPEVGYGNYSRSVWDHYAAINGSECTFAAPHSNCVITVYGELNGKIYRFKDQTVAVTVANSVAKPTAPATDLTQLQVVGAPDIHFSAGVTTYNVNLYQYQNHVQIIGTAAAGQVITVNGQNVLSGERSQIIEVGESTTVTVKANGKTYTLNLIRPEYPDIIITEVMQDTTGGKFDMLEIYNASGKDLDLKDYSIGFKKDYSYGSPMVSDNNWPYYFAGNDTGFHSTSGTNAQATQTGINAITKYSTYEPGGAKTEPASIVFPAGATMVIWVRMKDTDGLTYEDLIHSLTDKADTSNYDNKTLTVNGQAVAPTLQQLVVAEVPKGVSSAGLSVHTNYLNGYLENHGAMNQGSFVRTWLFILGKDAVRHHHNAITAAGNDIYSAAMLSRVSTSVDLSTVMYYDAVRGMSVVKDAGTVLGKPVTGYTSHQSGYMNLTSFGAIEHWQKPYDLADTKAPTATYEIKDGKLTLTLKDNTDVRYFELNLDLNGDGTFETVVKKDLVLESSAASDWGIAEAVASYTYDYDLGGNKDVAFTGYVLDGNNNKTAFGTCGDLTVTVQGANDVDVQIQLKGDASAKLESSYDILDANGKVIGTVSGKSLTGKATLSHGQKLIIKGLPEGVDYTVTATAPDGYKSVKAISGSIMGGECADVTVKLEKEGTVNGPVDGGEGSDPTDPPATEPPATAEPTVPAEPDMTFPSGGGGSQGGSKPTDPTEPGAQAPANGTQQTLLLILTIVTGIGMVAVAVVILVKTCKNKK